MGVQQKGMTRSYTMKRRAEQQAETRRRIVEAAIELHGSIGPARTNASMVAQRARVQRHTLYAHFPDERSLLLACSGLTMERDPLPDAEAWRAIAAGRERLCVGLRAIYDWYGRNERLAACVLRDAEHHALTKEMIDLRMAPSMRGYGEVLGEALSAEQQALLHLMLGYFTWRALAREKSLEQAAAVAVAVRAIESAAQVGAPPLSGAEQYP